MKKKLPAVAVNGQHPKTIVHPLARALNDVLGIEAEAIGLHKAGLSETPQGKYLLAQVPRLWRDFFIALSDHAEDNGSCFRLAAPVR